MRFEAELQIWHRNCFFLNEYSNHVSDKHPQKENISVHSLDVLIETFVIWIWVTNLTQKLFLPKWISKIMCPINTQKYYLVIKLNNYGHFPQFFFLKVALFHLQSLWLFFLFKYYMSVVPVKYLHFRFRQKWNVVSETGWNQGRLGTLWQERWNPVTGVASIKSCNCSEYIINKKQVIFVIQNELNWNFMSMS